MSGYCQMISNMSITTWPKISWYYPGLIRILKILSSCHDILLLWILATSRTTNKTKQTIMDFAGEMWHCKISVFYTPPSLLPPFKLWPPHGFDIIPRYWGQFPTRRGSWQSVIIKLWQYGFAFVLQIPAKTKWKLHHFLASLKTCLDSWRNVLVACPTHPMWCYCFHPCCSYLTGCQTYSNGHKTRYSTPQSRAEKLIIIEYFCGELTEMAAAKQTKTTQPTPNQCHAPENNY